MALLLCNELWDCNKKVQGTEFRITVKVDGEMMNFSVCARGSKSEEKKECIIGGGE